MWSCGSICHPVIIPSIFNTPPHPPCCWDRNNTKKKIITEKMDEATGKEMSRELEQCCQILDEIQPSRASVFLFTWGKLTDQDTLQPSAQISNQYFDWGSMCQSHSTTDISQRQKYGDRQRFSAPSSLIKRTCAYIFVFRLSADDRKLSGELCQLVRRVLIAPQSTENPSTDSFITVSSTAQSGKGKSIHWFTFTLQNVLFFLGNRDLTGSKAGPKHTASLKTPLLEYLKHFRTGSEKH